MNRKTQSIIKRIKSLEIQGARNIARAGVDALYYESEAFKGNDRSAYISNLLVAADAISAARPTEPMLRNYLKFMISRVMSEVSAPVSELKILVASLRKSIEKEMKAARERIISYGQGLIKDGMVVYTHCHSSTVTSILKGAYDSGRDFQVIVDETRPRFQGVKTAKELAKHGIPTTLVVDSAARLYVKSADLVLVGGDAVTAAGNLINKIGTSTLAHFAHVYEIPFYSAVELHKFDSLTRWGLHEPIEFRDPDEVLKNPPKNLTVINPAFDETKSHYITAYITERGLIPPQMVFMLKRGD